MEPSLTPTLAPTPVTRRPVRRSARAHALAAALTLGSCMCAEFAAAADAADSTGAGGVHTTAPAPPASTPAPAPPTSEIANPSPLTPGRLEALGFENVTVDTSASSPRAAYENRRYRHSIEAFARAEREAGAPLAMVERRLDLDAAAIVNIGTPDHPRFRVKYPSDGDYPSVSRRPLGSPTSRSVDLQVGPLLAYELGRTTHPIQFQFQIQPRVRYNPWPGARATASLIIPVYNDFETNELHPDAEDVRPGPLTLEQYAWLPRVALLSGTVGLFGDNRYGISAGAARPLWEGRFLIDGQVDLTGFIAFTSVEGTTYASMSQWSSFLGLTWRPPLYDLAIRGRIAQYVFGDQGEELDVTRSMGDVDFSLFVRTSEAIRMKGVRISIPVPPMTRGTRRAVRVQPIERFPFSYRTEVEPAGLYLAGVASREDFLRQLNAPALTANLDRFDRARGAPRRYAEPEIQDWISFTGTTGFILTPWAGTMKDRSIELSGSHIPKSWAVENRGQYAEEPWSLTIGLIPRVEGSLRFTRIPGKKGYLDSPGNKLNTDTDHMASGRLALLTPKPPAAKWFGRPGVAIGVDDVEGTKRYHSSYLVTGLASRIFQVQNRFSLGYAVHVFRATRHVLDGGFGAFEVSPWRDVAVRVEYDTEKWNAGIGVGLGYGLRLRAAALHMEGVSVGAGWYHEL